MKVSKEKLTQIIKEEFDSLRATHDPYFASDLQKLLRNMDSESIVQIIVNGQPVEIDEVWPDNESNTLNISVR